jgi:hypothetical protein
MKNKLKSPRRGSKTAAAPQSKTAQTGARVRPSCLCIYQDGQLAGEIPLVGHELPQVIIAACRQGLTVDQFIADAITEKFRSSLGEHAAGKAGQEITASVPVNLRIRTKDPEHLIELELDPEVSAQVKRAAATARLTLKELFEFILLRQLESFDFGAEHQYTVFGNAQEEVSSALDRSAKASVTIVSLAEAVLNRLKDSKLEFGLHNDLRAWTSLIFDKAGDIDIFLSDGSYHWWHHIVPALLERKAAPGAVAVA